LIASKKRKKSPKVSKFAKIHFTLIYAIFTGKLPKSYRAKKGDCFIFDGGNRPEYFISVEKAFLTHFIYISAQTGNLKKWF
jgi:hypothetical protein